MPPPESMYPMLTSRLNLGKWTSTFFPKPFIGFAPKAYRRVSPLVASSSDHERTTATRQSARPEPVKGLRKEGMGQFGLRHSGACRNPAEGFNYCGVWTPAFAGVTVRVPFLAPQTEPLPKRMSRNYGLNQTSGTWALSSGDPPVPPASRRGERIPEKPGTA